MTTTAEWSLEFDQFYNNITSNQAPGLTEHEKSIFLTRAQESLVLDMFSPKSNVLREGFDGSEIRQSDFFSLVTTVKEDLPEDLESFLAVGLPDGVASNHAIWGSHPSDILLLLNEEVLVGEEVLQVLPISYTEYYRLSSKPYKYPPKGRVWRLDVGSGDTPETQQEESKHVRLVQLISVKLSKDATNQKYFLRYVRKPIPIILPDEIDGSTAELGIDGYEYPQNPVCELPSHLHNTIIQRAVMLAKVAWNDNVALQGS